MAVELGRSMPSIVTWDDSLLCRHTIPRLTALSHDVVSFGSRAARRLLRVLDGEPPAAFLDGEPPAAFLDGEPPAAFLDSTSQLVVRDSSRITRS